MYKVQSTKHYMNPALDDLPAGELVTRQYSCHILDRSQCHRDDLQRDLGNQIA